MEPLQITYINEPPRFVPDLYPIRPDRYYQFIEAVSRFAGREVRRVERAFLKDVVPDAGFILLNTRVHPKIALDECVESVRNTLAARLIPLELTESRICETVLEPLSLAAGIDSLSLFDWDVSIWSATSRPGTQGLHGLRDVSMRIGADRIVLESSRYCFFSSSRHQGGLPHLLVDYLRELAAHRTRQQRFPQS